MSADFTISFQLWKIFEIEIVLSHLVKVFGFFCLKKEKFSLESLFQELPSL